MGAGSFGTDPGQPVRPQFQHDYAMSPPGTQRRTKSLAIVALCCGAGSYLVGPFASIPGIILGVMSLRQIRETGENGHAMAIVGLVLSVVSTLLILGVALFAVFVVFALNRSCMMGTSLPACD